MGRMLVIAWGALAIVIVVALDLFIIALPPRFAFFHTFCQATNPCFNDARLSPEGVESLTNSGHLVRFLRCIFRHA